MTGAVRTEILKLWALALPLVFAQLAQSGVNFVDTLMVGRLGGGALAGIALGSSVFGFVSLLGIGVLFAVAPLASQSLGAGDRQAASRAVRQGLWLALGLSVPGVLLFHSAEPLLLAIGQAGPTAERAAAYLRAISWGYPALLLLVALRGFLEAVQDTRPVMVVLFTGLIVNAGLNEVLIFGRFGLPALGLVGAGYASATVYALMLTLAALYIATQHREYRVFRGLRRPDPAVLRELVVVGVPIGLTIGFESGLFTVTALLMGLIGQVELAAHQIALQASSMAFNIPVGLALATAARVGRAAGRGDVPGARLAGFTGIGMSAAVMSLTATLFWLAPGMVVGLFIDRADPANLELARQAAVFLGFAAMFQVFDGVQVSASGALRGFKDTRVPMVISLVAYWLLGLTSGALLAFRLGLGGRGLWLGLVVGLAAASVMLVARFRWRARPPATRLAGTD